jgi:type IV pilus assembly protein PilB
LLGLLVQSKVFTKEEAETLYSKAEKSDELIDLLILRSGKMKAPQLAQALSALYKLNYIELEKQELEPEVLDLLGEEFIHDKKVLPFSNSGGRLSVAVIDPSDKTLVDEITFMTGMRPNLYITSQVEFYNTLQKYFNDSSASKLLENMSLGGGDKALSDMELMRAQQEAESTDTSNPLVQLVNSILQDGILKNASDIHIEPRQGKSTVRFRTDGILTRQLDIPTNMEQGLVSRIKVMAKMDISDHRRPQDGRISLRFQKTDYNLRVNTLPVSDGREKIVIRILRPSKQIDDFTTLGFNPSDIHKLETLYQAPYGIVLVCGPTGSGKTTTLYTMLHKINDELRNISTVEDPVELRIEGLNQSQVNPKADYTFASSLRAMMRQDPDVIMLGEIRDHETLESAIHAALTGHLVLSTIHSNTTAATLTRMREMGASSNLLATSLNGIIAQRLIRTLCPACKEPYEATPQEKRVLFAYDDSRKDDSLTLYKAVGCSLCNGTGFKGRAGLYEIMMVDRELRQMINTNQSDLELEDAAVSNGMTTLGMNGKMALLDGITTFAETVRVLGPTLSGN